MFKRGYYRKTLILPACLLALSFIALAPDTVAAKAYNYTYNAATNLVDGVINLPMAEAPCCGKTSVLVGNGKDAVYLENEPQWWSPTIKVISAANNTVQITDNHANGQILILKNVPAVYFAWGSGGLYLPSMKPTPTASPPAPGVCGPANKSTVSSVPTGNLCFFGTPSAVAGLGPFTWTCAGLNTGLSANCSASLKTAPQSCTDVHGGVHASGSTYTLQLSQTSGTTTATTQQCPYGGAQPTTTTVTQLQLCTNGILANQGSSVSTTTNNGSPNCNAPAACGSTPSGSTVTTTVSTNSGTTTATTQQCPYGGAQPTTTTVTQLQLCTNGTLANQGNPVSTTSNSGSPNCNQAPSTSYSIQLGGTVQSLLTPLIIPATTVSLAGNWVPTFSSTSTNDVVDIRNVENCTINLTGSANDIFYEDGCTITNNNTTGINTQITSSGWGVITLAPGFTNLIYIGGGSYNNGWITLTGNNLDDIIVANDNGIQMIAGTGNDILVGGKGNDTFVVPETTGNTAIINLHTGDTVTLDYGTFATFKAMQAAMIQQGNNVVLKLPNGKTLTFVNHQISDLVVSEFTPTSQGFTAPANGLCGASNGMSFFTTAPTVNLCSIGNASTVTAAASNSWTWSCSGLNGGTSTSCSTLLDMPTNGSCGAANGVQVLNAPASNLCSVGNVSSVSGSGPWAWSCNGINGGTKATCSAPLAQPISGACGPVNGSPAAAAPSAGLCNVGTASSVSGNGPWNWSCTGLFGGANASCSTNGACVGTPMQGPAALMMPPSVPQPVTSNDIVGVNLQITTPAATGHNFITFGQIFKQGQVQPGTNIVARIYGTAYPVQLDSLATWPDGSVKMASITLQIPQICGLSTVPALLSKTSGSDPVLSSTPVSLTATSFSLTATMAFTGGQYSGGQTVNLGNALKLALANSPTYWLHGALATQSRIDVPLPGGPLHLTADITAYADGSVTADVQFNNDLTTILPQSGGVNPAAPLPQQVYTAVVQLDNVVQTFQIAQSQYEDWHVVLNSVGAPLFSMATGTSLPTLNVQHDTSYLEHAGAILPYDLTTGVSSGTNYGPLYAAVVSSVNSPGFGAPLAINSVTTYMGTTGGRPDIGYTTGWNTIWLLSGDVEAAAVGLAQGDTGGSVPWNMKLANGHWLSTGDDATIWVDGRGGPNGYTDGIANVMDQSVWQPETAHQPNLNYVPYIMTASRWNLDRLNAQAAFDISDDWPGARCVGTSCTAHYDDIIMNGTDQIRAQAWSMREIEEAAFIGNPGSFEQPYYNQVVADTWNYVQSQEPSLARLEGPQAYGYWGLGDYGDVDVIPPWQEDYLSGTAVLGAEMGFSGAGQYIGWQKDNWLAGRFIGQGMNPYDGCVYNMTMGSASSPDQTWAQIDLDTIAAGGSNGENNSSNWAQSDGDYCPLARAVLGAALTLYPNDTSLQQALTWLNGANAPYTNQPSFQNDPTFNVVPLQ